MSLDWTRAQWSPDQRIWLALAPAIVITAYFTLGFILYNIRYLRVGAYHDEELSKRGSTALTSKYLRMYFVWVMQPVWIILLRTGLPANAITTLSVLLATGSGVALAGGRFALGGWLYIISGILDYLDGKLARARGDQSASGAALDSILDRYADAAILTGLAWYFRDSWVLLVALAAMAGSSFVPYIRAKGEVVGINMAVGIMQRAERIVYLGLSVAMSPIVEAIMVPSDPKPPHRLAIVGLVLIAVSTQLTAAHRLAHLLQALGGKDLSKSMFSRARGTLVPALVGAAVAVSCDYILRFILVKAAITNAIWAAPLGALFGAAVFFSLRRVMSFEGTDAKQVHVGRSFFAAFTGAALHFGGVSLMMSLPEVDALVAWGAVTAAVFITWNFPLHQGYLFALRD